MTYGRLTKTGQLYFKTRESNQCVYFFSPRLFSPSTAVPPCSTVRRLLQVTTTPEAGAAAPWEALTDPKEQVLALQQPLARCFPRAQHKRCNSALWPAALLERVLVARLVVQQWARGSVQNQSRCSRTSREWRRRYPTVAVAQLNRVALEQMAPATKRIIRSIPLK